MKIMGLSPTRVTEDAEFTLGTEGEDDRGREFVYVEADAAIAVGNVCIIHSDFGAQPITATLSGPGAGQGKPCGGGMAVMTTGQFGWLVRRGVGSDVFASASASAAAYTALFTTSTDGALDDNVANEHVQGVVLNTASGGAENELATYHYPFVAGAAA